MSFDDGWAPRRGGEQSQQQPPSYNQSMQQSQRGYQVSDADNNFAVRCQTIESNMHKLNNNVLNMMKMLDMLGGQRDTPDLRQQFTSMKEMILVSIRSIEHDIVGLHPNGPRQANQKDQLTNRLQGIMAQFRQTCQGAAQKEKRAIAAQRERERVSNYTASAYDEDNEQAGLMESNRRDQESQLRSQVRFNQSMIVEREEGMKEIESAVVEINDIFRDLALAVQDQGQVLDSIEANMTSADTHVEKGTHELVKASDYQKKARSKMLCLLVIIAIVAGILVTVLVTQLKK